jgi:hypothetical protein
MTTNPITPQLSFEDTLNGLKITWQGKRDWNRVASNAFSVLVNLLAFGIIAYYAGMGFFSEVASQVLIWAIAALLSVYMIYRIYRRMKDLIGGLLGHEIIQIDDRAVEIERSGFLNIERQVTYPADKINSIRTTAIGVNSCFYLSFRMGGDFLTRSRLSTDQVFCRGISREDAEVILGKVYTRFPQYRDIKP